MNSENGESPFVSSEIVERPLGPPEPDDMWDQLVDLCETDAGLEAVLAMYDEATAPGHSHGG